ncbi:MAG: AAA family ATPase [Thermodesulfobacteriota bacterium]|nr:AAA family ATPase [Thermodesulfobacteriota bacterium]
MYLDFYGLKEKPFSLTPDPQFLYLGESHRTAIDSLLYGIQQREGFMVVTGDIGTGKTTICRTLLEKLDRNVKTAVIFNSFLTEGELLRAILQDLGFTSIGRSKTERIDALNRFLLQQLSQGEHVLLIIDEAQNLSIPVLEQIRMLSNLETTKEKMLQIILFAQLELNQKLRSAKLKQLNQRIAIRHHILPLDREETESYIYQRLTVAGSHGGITFSKSALNEIYRFSQGIPRLINLICDRTLLGGFVDETYHIDKGVVRKAEKDLGGKEVVTPAYPSLIWSKYFPPLRIFLLMILFLLLTSMILLNHNQFPSLQRTRNFIMDKAEDIYLRISGERYSSSTIPLIREEKQEPLQNETSETSKDADRTSQEGTR